MTTYGTPEQSTRRLGEEFARMRTAKGLSRSKVIRHLPDESEISEAWLARLETGRVVIVSRENIEALCHALDCTARERARLLLYADRNVFDEPSPGKEILIYGIDQLYAGAREILEALAHDHRAMDLDEDEVLEIFAMALEAVLAERRDQVSKYASTGNNMQWNLRGRDGTVANARRHSQSASMESGVPRK